MKFVQVSDIHLGAPDALINGCSPTERLCACFKDINSWHSDAEFCVITGDLTEFAEPAAYKHLKEILSEFPLPCFLMLGNHDDRKVFQSIFVDYSQDENGFVQYSHRTASGIFLFLDTKKEGLEAHEGEMCNLRLKWLKEELMGAGNQPVYIFMHHPPFDIGLPYVDKIKLFEFEEFGETLKHGHNIKHIFFGHVHRMTSVIWKGIPFTSLPSLNHQIPLVSDSVNSEFCDEPPAYGVVTINSEQLTVHFNTFMQRNELHQTEII